jgi:hypothetical protein
VCFAFFSFITFSALLRNKDASLQVTTIGQQSINERACLRYTYIARYFHAAVILMHVNSYGLAGCCKITMSGREMTMVS